MDGKIIPIDSNFLDSGQTLSVGEGDDTKTMNEHAQEAQAKKSDTFTDKTGDQPIVNGGNTGGEHRMDNRRDHRQDRHERRRERRHDRRHHR